MNKYQIVMKNLLIGIAFLLFLATGLKPVLAQGSQDMSALQEKMTRLESTSEKNNREVAQAMNLLTQIQREFQSIRGQVEASNYLTKETDRIYQDLDLRVSALEDKIDQIHRLLKEMRVASPSKASLPKDMDPKAYEDYQALLDMVNARDFRGAASGFMGFAKKYPQSPYLGDAQFWVAESFYSMGDYAKAIKEFQKLVDKYPNNERVKEAIYKQGLSFMRLKKNKEAQLFFQKVMASYPNTAEAAKAQTRLHRIQEKEKKQLALNPELTPKESPEPSAGDGKTIYRPIMKPNPMPRGSVPRDEDPPGPSPRETGEIGTPVEKAGEGGSPSGHDSSAPLF